MDKELIIETIKEKIENVQEALNAREFITWVKSVKSTFKTIIPANKVIIKALEEIDPLPEVHFETSEQEYEQALDEAVDEAVELLENLISDISKFGIDAYQNKVKASKQAKLNVNVNQENNQTQTTHVNLVLTSIVDSIKDEITGSQLKELKAILESNSEPEQKKKNFLDKLKSFGSDVASNILASMLINPNVYTNIGRML